MKTRLTLIALAALALPGCGKFLDKFSRLADAGITSLAVSRSQLPLKRGVLGFQEPLDLITQTLNGGVIVYAMNVDSGAVYSESVADELQKLSMTLPNGNYEFMAVGWPTTNLTGAPSPSVRVRCGYGPSKTLVGGSDTVSLDLSNLDQCYNAPDFVPSYAKTTSPEPSTLALSLVFCNKYATITGKDETGSCINHESSGAFFNGDPAYTKVERVSYLSGTNTLYFTATHNSFISSGLPTKPYELFSYDFDTGVQNKIGMSLSAGMGITSVRAVPGRNKLLFIRDQDTSGTSVARELWVYDQDLDTLTQISQAPATPSTADGVREFRVSDGGDYVVFVGDFDTTGIFELWSAPLGGTTYPKTKISGALTGVGVASCGGCGGHSDNFYFQISPGTTNNYVLFSAERTSNDGISTGVASRADLRISPITGTTFDGVTVFGTSYGNAFPGGFRISPNGAGEIQVASDQATKIGFSHDGKRMLFHAKTSGGTVDKVYHLSVDYTPSALTVADLTTVVASNATYPYFKIGKTGTTTKKALVFIRDTANTNQPLVKSLNLMSPATTYPQFRFLINNGTFGQVYFTDDDAYVVAAAKDTTDLKVKEIRSAPVLLSNWAGGADPAGASVSHNAGGILAAGRWVNPIEADGDTERVFTVDSTETNFMFLSDETTNDIFQLYTSTIGAAGQTQITHTDLDTVAESVTSAAYASNDDRYFTANLDGTGSTELYEVDLSQTLKRVSMNSNTYMNSAISVVPKNDHDGEVFPSTIPILAAPKYLSGIKELWFLDPATNSYTRASTLGGSHASDSLKGAGRAMVRIVKNRFNLGEATAFQSDCLSLNTSSTDGNWITSNVRIPLGTAGGGAPFKTVVDVFPGATDCNGTPRSHVFPTGLADYSSSQGVNAKLAGDGLVDLLLFVRDP